MVFDPKKHLIKVQGGRQYLPVSARLIWFRSEHPDWGIETEPVAIDVEKQYAIFRARITNAEGKLMAVGTKMENVKGFPDYMEKAETGSVGRALALCGYGTQFSPELDEVNAGRFADSPQGTNRGGYSGGNNYNNRPNSNYNGGGGNNYGSNGGSRPDSSENSPRFAAPPREISNPADNASAEARPLENRRAPEMRPAEVRESEPRRETPTPVSEPRRETQAPALENTTRRPSAPVLPQDDDDDFEALIAGTPAPSPQEDDPFDDVTPPRTANSAPRPTAAGAKTAAPPAAAASSMTSNECVGCGKSLTKAQQELSIRNFGEALCPSCQKTRRPAAAAR